MKILLAEDDKNIQSIAVITLEKLGGHTVVAVDNGMSAFGRAQEEKFDLLILDGMMPEMDGFTTCTQVKNNLGPNQFTPVIFMTAKSQSTDIQEGFNRGAIGYIVKPFDVATLPHEIQKLYEQHLKQCGPEGHEAA